MSSVGPALPWPSGRRPLSVVVFGNSVASLQIPPRTDRADGTYGEVLADLLAAQDVRTVLHLESRWFDFLHRAMRDYETRLRAHAPDVVIVQFGLNEYQPWLLPVWLIRHLLVQEQAVTRPARAYRRHVAPPLWKAVRSYRRWLSPHAGLLTWQTSPRRFGGHLRRLVNNLRLEAKPLILVLDLDRPSGTLEHFLPGLGPRHARYQEVIARVVEDAADSDVRLIRVSEITAAAGPASMPDGMHYSPATHRLVGEALAAEVTGWLVSRHPS